jgi:hypothetical protein
MGENAAAFLIEERDDDAHSLSWILRPLSTRRCVAGTYL